MRHYALVELLASGNFKSGEELSVSLGITRSAIWKLIKNHPIPGVDIHAVRGKGYRIARPLELLSEATIREKLSPYTLSLLDSLKILHEVDSSNRYALGVTLQPGKMLAVLAERQTQGRGRRGRTWVSPYASNIYLSLAWRFSNAIATLEGLSLVAGIAVCRALQKAGVDGVSLKWPNDIYLHGKKLAGILIEMRGEVAGPATVVIGIGLNVNMPHEVSSDIDQPWTDLSQFRADDGLTRNRLASLLLNEIFTVLAGFQEGGFPRFVEEWNRYDMVNGKPVDLVSDSHKTSGVARGVDQTGALLLETDDGVKRILSGDVSLRFA